MRLITSLLIALFLFGCSSGEEVTHFQGIAHTHTYHIQVGGALSSSSKQHIKLLIDDIFEEVDTYYNRWNPLSELSLSQGKIPSPKLSAILQLAHTFKTLTGGRFDPTIGGVIAAWKESLKKGELPDLENIQSEIDLDGMLKGYAIDLLVAKLKNAGYQSIYVEWGGDIRVFGRHPQGRPWRILVEGEVVELASALACSGNTEQQWRVEGKTFTHIVDPRSLNALEVSKLSTVTVRAPTCALADALATAFMTLSDRQEALKWIEEMESKHAGVQFWIGTCP